MLTAVRKCYFRATAFGEALAPWRESKQQVARDLIENDLGSYDEYGRFFVTVPGHVETRYNWVTVDISNDGEPEATSSKPAISLDQRREMPRLSRSQYRCAQG